MRGQGSGQEKDTCISILLLRVLNLGENQSSTVQNHQNKNRKFIISCLYSYTLAKVINRKTMTALENEDKDEIE